MNLTPSRHAGRRIGDYLDRIIPIVVEFSKLENDDELRECCIQVFALIICEFFSVSFYLLVVSVVSARWFCQFLYALFQHFCSVCRHSSHLFVDARKKSRRMLNRFVSLLRIYNMFSLMISFENKLNFTIII